MGCKFGLKERGGISIEVRDCKGQAKEITQRAWSNFFNHVRFVIGVNQSLELEIRMRDIPL